MPSCSNCSKPLPILAQPICRDCATAKRKEESRARYQQRKDRGQFVDCKKPAIEGLLRCADHQERSKEQASDRRQAARAQQASEVVWGNSTASSLRQRLRSVEDKPIADPCPHCGGMVVARVDLDDYAIVLNCMSCHRTIGGPYFIRRYS